MSGCNGVCSDSVCIQSLWSDSHGTKYGTGTDSDTVNVLSRWLCWATRFITVSHGRIMRSLSNNSRKDDFDDAEFDAARTQSWSGPRRASYSEEPYAGYVCALYYNYDQQP